MYIDVCRCSISEIWLGINWKCICIYILCTCIYTSIYIYTHMYISYINLYVYTCKRIHMHLYSHICWLVGWVAGWSFGCGGFVLLCAGLLVGWLLARFVGRFLGRLGGRSVALSSCSFVLFVCWLFYGLTAVGGSPPPLKGGGSPVVSLICKICIWVI